MAVDDQQQQTQGGAVQQADGQRPNGVTDYHLIPRAEGYRPAVIRESRIKDRPYKPARDNLSIKIELDLEVEVSSFPPEERGLLA